MMTIDHDAHPQERLPYWVEATHNLSLEAAGTSPMVKVILMMMRVIVMMVMISLITLITLLTFFFLIKYRWVAATAVAALWQRCDLQLSFDIFAK